MWLLSFLPNFVIHLIFLMGVLGTIAGFVLGFIPFIKQYKLPIQVISLIVLSLGLWLEGGLSNESKWRLRVKEMEAKVAEAQAKAAETNIEIIEKIVTEKEYIRLKGEKIIEYIDREVKVFDSECNIPEVAIKAHDMSAKNEAPNE